MKKIISLALLLVVVLSGCSSSSEEETSGVLSDGTLDVGMDCDYAPYSWTVAENQASETAVQIESSDAYCDGYDVVMAQEIADEMGVELKIHKMTFDGLIPAVTTDQIDVIMAGISPSEERKEIIDFSDSYYSSTTGYDVVVAVDGDYADATTLADLDGAKISAQQGTTHVGLLDQIPNGQEADPQQQYITLIEQTIAGDIDGYIAEGPVATEQADANDELTQIVLVNDDTGFTIDPEMSDVVAGFNKGNEELVSSYNEALATISDEERIQYMNEAAERVGE